VSRPRKLDDAALANRLRALSGWTRQGDALRRVFERPSFADAITFVTRVAALAEGLDHHPDILIEYRRVTLTLTTHDAGGLTELDLELAARIDQA
jgi:4a-hydroxytetrahydrobiopterin dehydratase